MIDFNEIQTKPLGSMLTRSEDEQHFLLEASFGLPSQARSIITSNETGAYIRGLAKSYKLRQEQGETIAYAVLRLVLGQVKRNSLQAVLSSEVPLPGDLAEKMAREIEEDLLKPVIEDLKKFWAGQKQKPAREAGGRAESAGAKNVLNLKERKQPPQPPAMPSSTRY